MDSDSQSVRFKPIPLPRKSNRNFEGKSLSPRPSVTELSTPSDINSNIDNLMEQKPTLSKFSPSSGNSGTGNNKPVPLPRRFVRANGSYTNVGISGNNMPDLTSFASVSSAPPSITESLKSDDFEDDNDDELYKNIPSKPNIPPKESAEGNKRATINLFNRVIDDPFEDFESSIKEIEPLSSITFRSPIEDLDEAARSRISISSMSSSTTTTSKSSSSSASDYSDHYMEPPPARPLPVELTVGGGREVHSAFSSNTVPSKPKRSPNIVLPRLSSLEEGSVLSTSPIKKSVEKMVSCPPTSLNSSKSLDTEDLSYEPISKFSTHPKKFNTISSCSTKLHKSKSNSASNNQVDTNWLNKNTPATSDLPINSNFSNSKRVTVPNVDRAFLANHTSITSNHTSLNVTQEGEGKPSPKKFDPTAYDISDLHKQEGASKMPGRISSPFLDGLSSVKRRSTTSSLASSEDFKRNSDTGSETERGSVILRRHSSSRSTCSSVGSNGSGYSRRDSARKKIHEYDEVAIEDGNVVLLNQQNSESNSTLNNSSCFSLTSRNSVVQEFDPLFDARTNNVALGFPVTAKPLDLNDTQQHRYEYIDTDGDGEEGVDEEVASMTANEESPVPGVVPLCLDNPGYSPSTPRSSREIKVIDETYEPISSTKEGISPKLSPKPRMGTRVLRINDEIGKQNLVPPPAPSPHIVEEPPEEPPRDSLVEPGSTEPAAPSGTPSLIPPPASGPVIQTNFFRKFSSKFRLNSIKEEKDGDKRSMESLLNSDEMYQSITTPCKRCFEPHPESTKCKFAPAYRQNIVYSSHLYKTSGLKKELSKKWAVLAKAMITFYNEKSERISEIPLEKFAVVAKKNDHRVSQSQTDLKCFELSLSGGKATSHVFASSTEGERCAWMQKLIEVFTSSFPTSVLSNFDRGGWCFIKETVTSDWRPCWIILKERSLYYSYWKEEESFEMDLRKARSVVMSQKEDEYKCPFVDNSDVLTVDLICKLLYIQTESSKVTNSWEKLIKASASHNGPEFHEMQLTLDNVPVVVDKCIDFLYAHGGTLSGAIYRESGTLSEGIYRQSGSNTRITQLLQDFKNDAWAVQISHKDFTAHDVAGTLKRFFRTLPEPLVTVRLYNEWIAASSLSSRDEKMKEYIRLLDELPEINYNIMKKLMCHLYTVHELHEKNLMPLINLAPIWGPTLMNVDTSTLGQSYEIACAECEVIKDLIENYYTLFRVDPQEIAREKKVQDALENFHLGSCKRKCSGDMKIWIYVWEKDDTVNPPINVTLTPGSTAESIVQQICSVNRIKNMENITLHEVICNETLERPLHPSEKVVETVLRWSIWDAEERKSNYLILKKNTLYPSLVHYAKEPKSISGELKYADSKSKSFRKYTFQFSQASLKYFKDAKVTTELGSWKIEDIVWYMGCEPKRNAPTKWTFTFVKRNYPFKRSKDEPFFGNVIVCSSEDELHKWIGAMVIGEHPEGLNPIIV